MLEECTGVDGCDPVPRVPLALPVADRVPVPPSLNFLARIQCTGCHVPMEENEEKWCKSYYCWVCGGWLLPHGEPLSHWWLGWQVSPRGVGLLPVPPAFPGYRPEVYIIQYQGSLFILSPYFIHTHPTGQTSLLSGDGAPH